MFSVQIVANARAGTEQIGTDAWVPWLPSSTDPTVEWKPGERVTVDRVEFPKWLDQEMELRREVVMTTRGVLLDTERQRLLDLGWRILPRRA